MGQNASPAPAGLAGKHGESTGPLGTRVSADALAVGPSVIPVLPIPIAVLCTAAVFEIASSQYSTGLYLAYLGAALLFLHEFLIDRTRVGSGPAPRSATTPASESRVSDRDIAAVPTVTKPRTSQKGAIGFAAGVIVGLGIAGAAALAIMRAIHRDASQSTTDEVNDH